MAICVFMLVFQLSAAANAKKTKFNFKLEKASLEKLLQVIESKSDFTCLYSNEDVNKFKIKDLNVKDQNIEYILNLALEKTNLNYKIVDNTIVIMKKETKSNKSKTSQQKERIKVEGVVKDTSGSPLPGVSVQIKGTTIGVSTDVNGRYSISYNKGEKISLIFSFVGMLSQEVKVNDRHTVNVKLKTNVETLNSVVINGYSQIDSRKHTSSVVTVSGEKILDAGVKSLDNMLQGKIAGLSILNQTGTVGAAPKVRIRGASSISGNREPVWVVDGVILEDPVPISPTELNSLDNINLIGNAISFLNPEDIARIDVLKDASATAIYGVKAANGVIVISTKKGKFGPARINYSNNITVSTRPQYSDLNRMNSKERIDVSREAYERGLQYRNRPSDVSYEGALYDYFAKKTSYEQFLHKVKDLEEQNTDWLDLLFRTAVSQKHNLSISGANESTNYYFSGAYSNSEGTSIGNKQEQYNAMLKISTQVNKKLRVGLQLRASEYEKNYLHSSIDPFKYAYQTSRAIPCYNEDGSLAYYHKSQGHAVGLDYNIMNEIQNSDRSIESQSINFIGDMEYKIMSGLKLTSLFSYNNTTTRQKEWFNGDTYYAAKLRYLNLNDEFPENLEDPFYTQQCELPYGGQINNDYKKNTNYTLRSQLNYAKNIATHHNINTTVGGEIRSSARDGITSAQMGYLPRRGGKILDIDPIKFPMYKKRCEELKDVITDESTNFVSFFATFTYDYQRKYIINYNFRTDGSNKFGQDKGNRFLPIWSISGRWNAKREYFLEDVSWLNDLSLRASYGIQGNVSNDSNPNLIAKLGSADKTSGHLISTLDKLPNPDLRWEKTLSQNYAIDFSLFNGKFSFSLDYYIKKGKDMIVSKDVAITTGSSTLTMNAGNIENRGFDINMVVTPIRSKDFDLSLSINGGRNENKVTDTGLSDYNWKDYVSGNLPMAGKPVGAFYSYKFDKLDENGLPTYKDVEETDGITKEEMYKQMFSYSGSRIADIEGGFSLNLRCKNWRLGGLFYYSLGKDIRLNPLYENTGQYLPRPAQNMDDIFVNRWRKPGDEKNTVIPVLSNDKLGQYGTVLSDRKISIADNGWQMYNQSDLRVVSGDFLKLRNLSLSYSLDSELCKKIGLQNCRFRLEASNVFTIKDSNLRGMDPEQVSFSKDTGAVPLTPTYTFGVNLTL
jgi:TonB-linked SusC/RagA family outer membrane protein